MKEVTYKSVHSDFKLNGFSQKKDLCRVSYCLIKEGDEFEKSIGDFIRLV
jgi:O-succinylbenzoic acid--CoA ligase